MTRYEYKAMPAPKKGLKARGVRTNEERFALAMSTAMNEMARDGWEYQRTDTLAVEEKSRWARRGTLVEHTMLIFRRALPGAEVARAETPRAAATQADAGPRLVARRETEADTDAEPRFRREPELRRGPASDPKQTAPEAVPETTVVPVRLDRPTPPVPRHPADTRGD